ncbi:MULTISPECIES: endonuclease/exonuclease/phosphatase family protein [unclassified Rhizobium]|uniref:endonuclease/exonuclease/phosphatase family protein n=1 Tax=unclassified Rhizobium TaxID=2613769 RepID=UPI001ADC6164|nr:MULTISPECIES: endonuclease/exonuclease/phosphatase family protein [unclassified Rhizobium]MBO9097808.1 endonuclease/exonuclease/phosphatase family protein [Rhizobium sp. L58/93]MBO9167959.1 endonuclease/exonuclease/phosphatase family protein [Rhizobium sp. L245/93]MBO9184003.1 endonuclease/exonuclease/phosphatase family protein [Rhizobium sp. E27B/91]MBO9133410.1 endonuclease/exonuclease/phosphatase family protein [Rhizobium sp. B209b/85]QXZ84229.1 endonuclease/exonuclease/phosphatase famil
MRVLCLNGWGGRLYERLVAYVAAVDPDVLCLQEVVKTPGTGQRWLTYRDQGTALPQRANFLADVAVALPHHTSIFCPAAEGDLFDGEQPYKSQWGLATFVRATIPIIGQTQGFVHGDYSSDGYGLHPRSRTAHAVRLFDVELQQCITIAQMHGLRELSGKHDTPERHLQANRFALLIMSTARPGEPVVACGDFNLLPESKTFDVLRNIGLTDLVTGRGFRGTRTSFYAKRERYADYMLVNDTVGVEAFEVVSEPEVSDHSPLLLTVGATCRRV